MRLLQGSPVFEQMVAFGPKHAYGDGLAIIAHPMPGTVAVMHAWSEHPIELLAHDRRVLTRIALHLDAAFRLRTVPETAVAEISARGAVDRIERAPDAERLKAHVKNMRVARKSRDPKMWAALVEGRVSVVARGGGFLVLENPPSQHSLRALTPGEASVVSLAARGLSTKLVAYGLGVSPSVVSQRLAQAAAKVGLFSRPELLRLAMLLTRDARSSLDEALLSDAEREVYQLLRRGLSNRAIASLRSRSLRTIANQVASILRKTRRRSRRELLTNASDD
jgi:DNA-binding CsgD family transcriptional regulator